ncbi:Phosphodiesterase [anaerobic digester metagenome]|uniref:Phosphodiesterase n=1 Tax=anaerobic digester metagenome TaxID=1263854 RepID=A0A485M6B3_9ZZZZ
MKICCPHCGKEYTIKREALRSSPDTVSIPCPNCQKKILLHPLAAGSGGPDRTSGHSMQTKGTAPVTGEALKQKIFKTLKDLPPMPQVVQKARKVLSDPKSSFSDLAKVIESDQGIVTRVLKMANSPYYGLSGSVSSVKHASIVLGTKTLMELLDLACSSEILGQTLEGYDLAAGDLWMHSLAVANGSQLIARRVNPSLELDAFSAGLIHDVGKIILDPYIMERKAEFQSFARERRDTFLSAEKGILGFDHAELASEVCERWQIPRHIVTAIRYHHDPEPTEKDTLSFIVHLADAAAIMSGIGAGIDGMLYAIHKDAMSLLRLKEDDLFDIMGQIVCYVEKTTQQV